LRTLLAADEETIVPFGEKKQHILSFMKTRRLAESPASSPRFCVKSLWRSGTSDARDSLDTPVP